MSDRMAASHSNKSEGHRDRGWVLCVLWVCVLRLAAAAEPDHSLSPLTLWYDEPAERWVEALPVGNGRLGAMVFGRVTQERIQINEDTLWTGQPQDYQHAGAKALLPEIRRLLFAGEQREAEKLAMQHFMSSPLRQEAYQPFADLILTFPGHTTPMAGGARLPSTTPIMASGRSEAPGCASTYGGTTSTLRIGPFSGSGPIPS